MTPDEKRTYFREYMRRYRSGLIESKPRARPVVLPPPTPACLICGGLIPVRRYFYCSRTCSQKAANRRYRSNHRDKQAMFSRRFRERKPEAARMASENWRRRNPNYWRTACPECGALMGKGRARCVDCRRKFEAVCVGNVNCGVKRSHKHCACGEPIYRRWDALCVICEAERSRLGVTVAQFCAACEEDGLDAAA